MKDFVFDNELSIYVHPHKPSVDYRDGGEEYLLSVIKANPGQRAYSLKLANHIKDWPSRYHLSFRRTNLLESIKEIFNKDSAVLELGSGCGTLTRWLGENFSVVDAVEGSKQRAVITKERTKDLNNVNVFNGDILSICYEPSKYGLVTIIGVMEYIPYYSWQDSDHKKPCIEYLKNLSCSLKDDGILLLAIENKIGAKYFTGCLEDHTGRLFDGLIGYPDRAPVTFSRGELKEILLAAGFKTFQFYHVFPDYKLPETVIRESDEVLPLFPYNWIRTPFEEYSGERLNLMPELLFLKNLATSKLFWEFSNSYLILAGKTEGVNLKTEWLIKKFYNSDRSNSAYHHTVSLLKGDNDEYQVHRSPLCDAKRSLKSAELDFNLIGVDRFIPGELLLIDAFSALVSKNPEDAIFQLIKSVFDSLISNYYTGKKDEEGYHLVDGITVDYVFWNLIKTPDQSLCSIDRKWKFREQLPADFVLFRSLYGSYVSMSPFIKEKDFITFITDILNKIYSDYGEERLIKNLQLEESFQSAVHNRVITIELFDIRPSDDLVNMIKTKDMQLVAKDKYIQFLLNSYSWRVTEPLRWLHEKMMAQKGTKNPQKG